MSSSPLSSRQTGTETCRHLPGVWQREVEWLGLIPPVLGGVNTLMLREHRWAPGMCKKSFLAGIPWSSEPFGCSILELSQQHLAQSLCEPFPNLTPTSVPLLPRRCPRVEFRWLQHGTGRGLQQ